MSTTGTVINYVFNAIDQYGDKNGGAPLRSIVDVVSHNLANDHVTPRPRNILTHTRRAIDYGLTNGLVLQLSPGVYKLNETAVENTTADESMDDDYGENNLYAPDDRGMDYPRQACHYRRSQGPSHYQEETSENPYYKDRIMDQDKRKKRKGSFLPAQIPACPVGPTDPQEPSGPGEPRPPLEPPPYTGGAAKSNRSKRNHTDQGNDLLNKNADDGRSGSHDGEMNDDDHDCDFDGDSEDYDNDICSEEFNDFEDDAVETLDEKRADHDGGNADDDDDDDDDQDSEDEEEPENYDANTTSNIGETQLRKVIFKKPLQISSTKKDKRKRRNSSPSAPDKRKRKKNEPCCTCCCGSNDAYRSNGGEDCQEKHPQKYSKDMKSARKWRINDNKNNMNVMALGGGLRSSQNIMKRYNRNPDMLRKRLQIAAGKLSQSTEDCCIDSDA